jgi:hypothetical protein
MSGESRTDWHKGSARTTRTEALTLHRLQGASVAPATCLPGIECLCPSLGLGEGEIWSSCLGLGRSDRAGRWCVPAPQWSARASEVDGGGYVPGTSYLPEFMEVGSDDAHAKHSCNHLHPLSPATFPPTPRHHETRLVAEASPTRLLLPGPLPRPSAVCSASWPQVAT